MFRAPDKWIAGIDDMYQLSRGQLGCFKQGKQRWRKFVQSFDAALVSLVEQCCRPQSLEHGSS